MYGGEERLKKENLKGDRRMSSTFKLFAICIIFLLVTALVTPAIMFLRLYELQEQDTKQDLETEILILESENAQLREMLSILRGEQGELRQKVEQWLEQWEVLTMEASAYAPLDNQSGICNDGNSFSTATGTVPGEGTFAVNPELIPYFSKMFIMGDGWVEHGQALDTGAAMRGPDLELPRVDIFKRTHSEAMKFGRQRVWAVIER